MDISRNYLGNWIAEFEEHNNLSLTCEEELGDYLFTNMISKEANPRYLNGHAIYKTKPGVNEPELFIATVIDNYFKLVDTVKEIEEKRDKFKDNPELLEELLNELNDYVV